MDIFLFIAAILSMIATAAIIHLVCRHTKLKALLQAFLFSWLNKQRQYLVLEKNSKIVPHNGTQ